MIPSYITYWLSLTRKIVFPSKLRTEVSISI